MKDKPRVSITLPFPRNRYFFLADVLLMALAGFVSFALRLDVDGLRPYTSTLLIYVALSALVKPLVFYLFGLYRCYWLYASARELLALWLAALAGIALTSLALYSPFSLLFDFRPMPRSISVIDWLLSFLFAGGMRFFVRALAGRQLLGPFNRDENPLKCSQDSPTRVLVMGAGEAGAMIVREMQENPGVGLLPVGLLDDDPSKQGLRIHGVPVLGSRACIPQLVRDERVEEVIIAMPTAPGQAIRDVVEICQRAGVAYKTIPGIYELISGQVSVQAVREVGIDDLLRRDPVQIDGAGTGHHFRDRVVLVTGAGGSIGAELCRQIGAYGPRRLLLLGHGETSIYHVRRELAERLPDLDTVPVIADIRDQQRLHWIFERHRPAVVFHAAAHKHVPLMEENVAEAVSNNVFGTRALLRAALESGVARFVLISTDKAVNPVNVMGATKRLAEMLVQDVARREGRVYTAVRFGNVLGSRGSVIPLFQRQIANGGPITVTHPRMERFFMTIPEAVQLVIQAATLGAGGEIFVLDMGEQVRIVELANELIRLSGFEPGRDIEIAFTGPRPGEKLSEELFAEGEKPRCTQCQKILMAYGNHAWRSDPLARHLEELEALVRLGSREQIQAKLQDILPRYRPALYLVDTFRKAFAETKSV
ncbi:MAG TPA: polysaccharide biosynthesis protein [Chloroflexi bacterium]|nr:polysaccharide biosynthesis protein [Chloroflexota bacterium]